MRSEALQCVDPMLPELTSSDGGSVVRSARHVYAVSDCFLHLHQADLLPVAEGLAQNVCCATAK